MKKKNLPLEEAIGHPLSHDLTQISPQRGFKGARFKKGHVVEESDLEILRSMGRAHLTVLELEPQEVHEDDASVRLSRMLTGDGVSTSGPSEGKCTLKAERDGLLHFDTDGINGINLDPSWIVSTLPVNVPVKRGEIVAGFRVLPLAVDEEQVKRAEEIASPISVIPFYPLKLGLVTTGKELAEGRIKDSFRPKLEVKIAEYGGTIIEQTVVPDEKEVIVQAINHMVDIGAEAIICTGGMSVDADDVTSSAIKTTTGETIFKGIPVLPGCHIMLARKGGLPVLGVPAGAVFETWTSLDLLLPRVFAGILPSFEETRRWGVGGLCRHCEICNFPNCGFASR